MLRHQGKNRKFIHNLKIASLLSFVAGFVNVAGYLSINILTTNVTGHFAFFMDDVLKLKWTEAFNFFLLIFFFLFGAFSSNMLMEIMSKKEERRLAYLAPVVIEIIILLGTAVLGKYAVQYSQNYLLAYSLLFAMGLQNALVTKISNAVVRTTHLTGLFTDLGIDLSQLFIRSKSESAAELIDRIKLRMSIISFFFAGGIFGGLFYIKTGFWAFIFPAGLLITGSYYDNVKYRLIRIKRKRRS